MSGPSAAMRGASAAMRGPSAAGASNGIAGWVTTTDHKRIGIAYLVTAFGFMLLAGLLAEAMRAELAQPGLQFVDESTYSQLFTIHGTLMMLFFAGPIGIGFGNYLLPLQIGAADMAFPRLNALSYWLFLFGGLVLISGFGTSSGAAFAGWTGYAPLSESDFASGPGTDLWIVGLGLVGISGILGALNFMTTVFARRAPGMTMFRLPLFTWAIIVTSILILFTFPVITSALAMLFIDRHLGGSFFDPARGGDPILWQHLFWFFGHPEVYIVVLPAFGIVSEIVPVFSSKPLFGYRSMVLALVAIAGLSMGVWAHHMFTTGAINLAFFSIVSFFIAVPTGIKIFNWIATMWRGAIRLSVPLLWCVGLIYVFTVGGISGVMVASPPLDFQAQDTYFVVAHMHNVLIGGTVFGAFAGVYFWFPKITGRFLDERLGRLHWLSWIVGFAVTFVPQYELGLLGMPRRIADYPADPQWATLNLVSTIGALILGLGTIPFLVAVVVALRKPATVPADPWEANSLEWATSSPPPTHNFDRLPPIRSERPVFDARHAADVPDDRARRGPSTAPSPASGAGP
ncbi:MAG TPA: cytochrome c oxidase subunit I [Candidatus Limnocylindrales bacterium]|nr:cytochrome c oxidase subunit I [Candidatus Limnocylindrales bacterium]